MVSDVSYGGIVAYTLGQGAQLVADASFTARVRAAMIRAAVNVSTETQGSFTVTVWSKRRLLAIRILGSPDSVLPSFVGAVAADPNSSLTWYAPQLISSSTSANPIVITTSAAHGYTSGDVVEILNHTTNTNANGTWVVTVVSSTTFSIPQPGNGTGGATGTVQKMETDSDLVFTVNSVFSAVAGIMPGD
jgi:hypothetical protein